jgi:hypothetical protein
MSSLRISQQSRAIGTPSSGAENSRPETVGEGASFAVALGAVAAAPKQATTWFGGQGGDSAGDSSGAASVRRKRSDVDHRQRFPFDVL